MSKTIQFYKYTPIKFTRWQRVGYWFKRRRIIQWYYWKRYGKKVNVTITPDFMERYK